MRPKRTSQQRRRDFLLFALAGPMWRRCNWPSIPSRQYRPLAWWNAENDAKHWNVRSTHSLLLQSEAWPRNSSRSAAARLRSASLYGRAANTCFHRAPILPYFPCFPSVTRSVLIPRPAARRVSASASPPRGFRLSENLLCKERKKDFPNLPKKRRLALGAGHTRVALRKSVPRAIRANTTKEN